MRHTAERLIPYAVNDVVHIDNVRDPALRRMAKDKRLQPLIRRALKEKGEQYELLVPYAVDDPERQLKRYIQYKLGTTVNLTTLREGHYKTYLKLFEYGSPADVLRSWGLGVTYSQRVTEEEVQAQARAAAVGGEMPAIGRNSKLYQALSYYAGKQNLSVGGYLNKMGIFYKGRK